MPHVSSVRSSSLVDGSLSVGLGPGVSGRWAIGGKKEVRGVDVSGMLIGVCAAVATGVVDIGEKVAFTGVLIGGEAMLSVVISLSVIVSALNRSLVGFG